MSCCNAVELWEKARDFFAPKSIKGG